MQIDKIEPRAKKNKEMVLNFVHKFVTGDLTDIDKYVATDFISHLQPGGANSRKNLLEDIKKNKTRKISLEVIRCFGDERYVLLHMKVSGFGPFPTVVIEVFRLNETHQIAEQWITMTKEEKASPLGFDLIDGETKIDELSHTEKNKRIIKEFVTGSLGVPLTIDHFKSFDENFVLHSTQLRKKGLMGVDELLIKFAEKNQAYQMEKLHLLFGEGNFVFAGGESSVGTEHVDWYYIFRLKKERVVEQWEIVEVGKNDKTPVGFKKW